VTNVERVPVIIRFIGACEEFLGADGKSYGPFQHEDLATIPTPNAQVLVHQGVALVVSVPSEEPAPEFTSATKLKEQGEEIEAMQRERIKAKVTKVEAELAPDVKAPLEWSEEEAAKELARMEEEDHRKKAEARHQVVLATACSGFEHTDLGNSDRFIRRYGDIVRYCYHWKSWLVWNGTIWERDAGGAILALAADTVRWIHHEADHILDDKRKEVFKWALTSEGERAIRNMLKLAEHRVAIAPDELNRELYYFTVRNKTIELDPFVVRDPLQEDLITQCANVDYDPVAKAPTWEKHIKTVFKGKKAIIDTFQEICGTCLFGENPDMLFIIAYGTGKNGKSVTLSVLSELLGDYSRTMDPSTLMVQRIEPGGEAPRPDIVRLRSGRFVTCVETKRGRGLKENLLKQLTGADKISVRGMYVGHEEFYFGGKIFLASNNKPRLKELSTAISERVVLIPFTHYFPEETRDPDITKKLLEEKSGILNWCIEGWKRIRERTPHPRIVICKEIRDATKDYIKENDDIGPFLEKNYVMAPMGQTIASELRRAYRDWCKFEDLKPMDPHEFADALRDHGLMQVRKEDARYWQGIRPISQGNMPLPDDVLGEE
jgi:putative DNA primase/helicase